MHWTTQSLSRVSISAMAAVGGSLVGPFETCLPGGCSEQQSNSRTVASSARARIKEMQ
jgi:hypothetical protein